MNTATPPAEPQALATQTPRHSRSKRNTLVWVLVLFTALVLALVFVPGVEGSVRQLNHDLLERFYTAPVALGTRMKVPSPPDWFLLTQIDAVFWAVAVLECAVAAFLLLFALRVIGSIFAGGRKGLRKAAHTVSIIRPVIPIILLAVGAFIPALNVPVGWPWEDGVPWGLIAGELVIVFTWLVAEFITVNDRDTPTSHLQADDGVSLFVALVVTGFCAWWHGRYGYIPWWAVCPWVGVTVDAWLSGYMGINNAAQKPIGQFQVRTQP